MLSLFGGIGSSAFGMIDSPQAKADGKMRTCLSAEALRKLTRAPFTLNYYGEERDSAAEPVLP